MQTRCADLVIVVCRDDDYVTHELLSADTFGLPVRRIDVRAPGVVSALNAGLDNLHGDVVAITDDDAAPRPDWLGRIEDYFTRLPDVGGVGGRDYVHGGTLGRESKTVGMIQWFGRQVGNHHLGIGGPRSVHMLKGVNMSFRVGAIGDVRFDARLRGTGAQVHNELAFCLAVRRGGWRLIYDPAVAVDHHPAQRFDEDQRSEKSILSTRNAAFNETLILLEYLPKIVQPIFMLWAVCVGASDLPGIGQCVRLALRREAVWFRLLAIVQGRFEALITYLSLRPTVVDGHAST